MLCCTPRMSDAIIELVEGAITSPWVYLALFAFAAWLFRRSLG